MNDCRDGLSTHHDADVLIVGAGIAGLGMACALARYDLRIVLLERRRETGGIHRGDSLLPKTTGVLARWGVLEAFRQAGAQAIDRLEIHDHQSGLLSTTPLAAPHEPTPYLVLPHARIEAVLQEQALRSGRVTIRRPARAVATLEEGGRIVGVRFESRGEGHVLRARLVIGADGGRSVVRAGLGIEAQPHSYDHAYLGLEAERPADYENAMRLHLHPRGGVLVMPRTDRVGVGVLVEAGSGPIWAALDDEALSREISSRAPILRGMRLFRRGMHVYELRKVHAPRYLARGAVIIGDAAHATNPTAGQGMATALADAEALANEIGPALVRGEFSDAALARYERRRWPVNDAIVRRSHRLATFYALRGSRWHRMKTGLVRALANPIGRRMGEPLMRAFLQEAATVDRPAPLPVPAQARS